MKTFSSAMYDKYHLVRTHKFPKSCHFLPRYTHTYVCVSGDNKWQFFGMFCARTKWMSPVVKLINRSSREEVFLRKGVVKVCSKFTGEDPCRSVISINLLYDFISILAWFFSYKFAVYFQNTSGRLLLYQNICHLAWIRLMFS